MEQVTGLRGLSLFVPLPVLTFRTFLRIFYPAVPFMTTFEALKFFHLLSPLLSVKDNLSS